MGGGHRRTGTAPRRRAHECPPALEGLGGDAEPAVGPEDVGDRHVGFVHHGRERRRQDLLGIEVRPHLEAGGTRSAHPDRVPGALELHLGLLTVVEHQDLILLLSALRAPDGGEQVVGVLPVADGRRLLDEAQLTVGVGGHGRDRPAHVATGSDLGRDRGDESLLGRHPAQVVLEPDAVEVTDDRGDLDLVHGEHHRR